MTGDSASVASSSSQPFPNVMGDVTWREALRQDLAHSPMFIGTDEGGLLAQRMDLVLDVHATLTSAVQDLLRDAMGRKRINPVTRLGAAGVPAPRPDGRILLHLGRHYTVARPAAPGEPGQFVDAEGSAYVEITREAAGLENPVPVIPSDGHCLIASLHFLKHGKLPDPGQVSAYRAQVAMDLAPEALSNLVLEMAEEVVRQPHPMLDNGCFATLGPRVSALLENDPHFMKRYHLAVKAAQEAALKTAQEAFWLDAGSADDEGSMEPTFLTLRVPE